MRRVSPSNAEGDCADRAAEVAGDDKSPRMPRQRAARSKAAARGLRARFPATGNTDPPKPDLQARRATQQANTKDHGAYLHHGHRVRRSCRCCTSNQRVNSPLLCFTNVKFWPCVVNRL